MKHANRLTWFMTAIAAAMILTSVARAADPGVDNPNDPAVRFNSEANDQKKGSVLFFNVLSSSASSPATDNSRFNITNTNTFRDVSLHLFFVDGGSCSVADTFICLTRNQTASFTASDADPGTRGHLTVVAVNANGRPITFDWLIGDEYVKFPTGHTANLGAEAVSVSILPLLVFLSPDGASGTLFFDGICYNRLPRTLAVDSVPSAADGNSTLLILNRPFGNLVTGGSTIGALFGIFYDDAENTASYSFTGGCQFRAIFADIFPRTVPRLSTFIPKGHTGWTKFWTTTDTPIFGSVINFNPNANGFNGGHNLHKLTLTANGTMVIPIFPSGCPFRGDDDGDGETPNF